MIQLRAEVITVTDGPGSALFDPEELELSLARCCRAAGLRDAWLPEDLALAVEDALLRASERRVYQRDEIHRFVLKVLCDLGLGEVAEHYRLAAHPAEDWLCPEATMVTALLIRHLGLPDAAAARLALETVAACHQLGLAQAAPTLLVELARHLRKVREPARLVATASPVRSGSLPALVSREEILALVEPALTSLLTGGALVLPTGISRLFPALKLDLQLMKLAVAAGWQAPVTELVVLPVLPNLADQLRPLLATVRALAKERGHVGELPVVLRCPDLAGFTTVWLGAAWPEGAAIGQSLLETLGAQLAPPIRMMGAGRRTPKA